MSIWLNNLVRKRGNFFFNLYFFFICAQVSTVDDSVAGAAHSVEDGGSFMEEPAASTHILHYTMKRLWKFDHYIQYMSKMMEFRYFHGRIQLMLQYTRTF